MLKIADTHMLLVQMSNTAKLVHSSYQFMRYPLSPHFTEKQTDSEATEDELTRHSGWPARITDGQEGSSKARRHLGSWPVKRSLSMRDTRFIGSREDGDGRLLMSFQINKVTSINVISKLLIQTF